MLQLILSLLISFLISGDSFAQSKPAKGYEKKQILFLKWGPGNYEIGLKAINHGPTAMAVDKDENIYITDPWNKRIQEFSIDGKFIKSVSSDGIGPPLAVNDDGDIFTTYGSNGKWTGKLQIIKKTGERIKCNQSFGEIYNENNSDVQNGQKFFSFYQIKGNSPAAWNSSKFNEPLLLKKDMTVIRDASDENDVKSVVTIKSEKISRLFRKNGKLIGADTIKLNLPYEENGAWLDLKPLGFDNDGNIFILMGYETPSYGHLTDEKIRVFAIKGNMRAEIPLQELDTNRV